MLPAEAVFWHMPPRAEGIPLLVEKFQANAATRFSLERVEKIFTFFGDVNDLQQMAVNELVEDFNSVQGAFNTPRWTVCPARLAGIQSLR